MNLGGSHTVAGELDAAYARSAAERFDGRTHPEGHDGVAALLTALANLATGAVDLTVSGTNIRLNLSPESAAGLGRILISEAARSAAVWTGAGAPRGDQDGQAAGVSREQLEVLAGRLQGLARRHVGDAARTDEAAAQAHHGHAGAYLRAAAELTALIAGDPAGGEGLDGDLPGEEEDDVGFEGEFDAGPE